MLTKEQCVILNKYDRSGKAIREVELKLVPGFHYCPDWDYLPVCDDSPEISGCTCEVKI